MLGGRRREGGGEDDKIIVCDRIATIVVNLVNLYF